jgi:hypothetical protein
MEETRDGGAAQILANADGHGIVPDGFDLKIAGGAQFPCTVLLAPLFEQGHGNAMVLLNSIR